MNQGTSRRWVEVVTSNKGGWQILGVLLTLSGCEGEAPETSGSARQSLTTSAAEAGAGGTAASGGVTGEGGGATSTGSSALGVGGISAGGTSSSTVRSASTAWITELKIDPPSTDGNYEFIELAGEPDTTLSGYWLVIVEGDSDSNLGQVDKVIDLGDPPGLGCRLGKNGRTLLIAAEGAVESQDLATPLCVVQALVRGGLENGTGYLGLFSGVPAPVVGTDFDPLDTGVLEFPSGAVLRDHVAWTDGGTSDALYSPHLVGPKPAAHAAFRCDEASSATSWRFGQLLGDAPSLTFDVAHFSTPNLSSAELTPGAENRCESPPVAPPGVGGASAGGTSMGGTNAGGASAGAGGSTTQGGANTGGASRGGASAGGASTTVKVSLGGSTSTTRSSSTGGTASTGSTNAAVGGRSTAASSAPVEAAGGTVIYVSGAPAAERGSGGSTFWNSEPFAEPALTGSGSTLGDSESSGGDGGSGGDGSESPAQSSPSIPGGCSMGGPEPQRTQWGTFPAFLGLFAVLGQSFRHRRRRNRGVSLAQLP